MRAVVVPICLLVLTQPVHGQNQEPGIPKELLAKLADSDPKVRRLALSTLGQANLPAKDVMPVLVTTLSDPEPGNRLKAMVLMAQYGPLAKDAVPALIEICKTDVGVGNKKAAIETLGKIGPDAMNAQDVLMVAVKRGQLEAITALGQVKSKKAISLLLDVLKKCEPDNETGEGYQEGYAVTARALGAIGVSDPQVLATLRRGLNLRGDFSGHYAADADTALRMLKARK